VILNLITTIFKSKLDSHVKTIQNHSITREMLKPEMTAINHVFSHSENTSYILIPNKFLSSRIRFQPAKSVNRIHQYKIGFKKACPIPFTNSIPHVSNICHSSCTNTEFIDLKLFYFYYTIQQSIIINNNWDVIKNPRGNPADITININYPVLFPSVDRLCHPVSFRLSQFRWLQMFFHQQHRSL